MRLAVFGDIHGNLPALRAVLDDLQAQGADERLCLGDVATGGPWPGECLREVAALGCPVVRGNADRELLGPPVPFRDRGFPDERELYDQERWSAAQVTAAGRGIVAGFLDTAPFPDLLAFHGSPERDDEVLEAQTPDTQTPEGRLAELRAAFGTAPVWVGGHTHKPLLRTLEGWTLLNPGSVGLPFEKRGGVYVNPARAEYLLLDRVPGGWQPTFRRVPYPVEEIRQGFRTSGIPHAEWAAAGWVPG